MKKQSYRDKLNDERWTKKRDKILSYADNRCQMCGAQNVSLQAHHSYYIKGADPWEYPDGSLIALCQYCHGVIVHGLADREVERATNEEVWDSLIADGIARQLRKIGFQSDRWVSGITIANWVSATYNSLRGNSGTPLSRGKRWRLLQALIHRKRVERDQTTGLFRFTP